MIIDFTFENFTSFRDEVSFSMTKTRERQHPDHIVETLHDLKLLPIAAIFGANASGKSNFIRALKAMKGMVVQNLETITPFVIDRDYTKRATNFIIKLLSNSQIYEYSFSLFENKIQREYLKKYIQKSNSLQEVVLYDRCNQNIQFDPTIDSEVRNRLNVQYEGTDAKQLFLNNVYFQNKNNTIEALSDFKDVYHWFNKLLIIDPDTISGENPLGAEFHEKTNALIPLFDLGFDKADVTREEITDQELLQKLKGKPDSEKMLSKLLQSGELQRVGCFIEEQDGKYFYSQIVLSYAGAQEARLPFIMASDGSKRIIHLSPVLNVLLEHDAVVVIDELDRSLHTLLARRFIEKFLEDCSSDRRSQLIFTTHDVTLMDQDIFRRDELWIVERTNEHVSKMFSLIEYKDIRNDKDIRRSYLNGRFGGIPKILL